jgi:hypothetical protein
MKFGLVKRPIKENQQFIHFEKQKLERYQALKVVTNEKGEAVGEVLTII